MNDENKSRTDLERKADEVRSKLMQTVEVLDQRRHEALDIPLQLERHKKQAALGGAVVLTGAALLAAMIVRRVSSAAQRRRHNRWALARDVWLHPERAVRSERRSFFGELTRSVLLSTLTTAATIIARRAVTRMLEESAGGESLSS